MKIFKEIKVLTRMGNYNGTIEDNKDPSSYIKSIPPRIDNDILDTLNKFWAITISDKRNIGPGEGLVKVFFSRSLPDGTLVYTEEDLIIRDDPYDLRCLTVPESAKNITIVFKISKKVEGRNNFCKINIFTKNNFLWNDYNTLVSEFFFRKGSGPGLNSFKSKTDFDKFWGRSTNLDFGLFEYSGNYYALLTIKKINKYEDTVKLIFEPWFYDGKVVSGQLNDSEDFKRRVRLPPEAYKRSFDSDIHPVEIIKNIEPGVPYKTPYETILRYITYSDSDSD